jgi:hypothetical protein
MITITYLFSQIQNLFISSNPVKAIILTTDSIFTAIYTSRISKLFASAW